MRYLVVKSVSVPAYPLRVESLQRDTHIRRVPNRDRTSLHIAQTSHYNGTLAATVVRTKRQSQHIVGERLTGSRQGLRVSPASQLNVYKIG